MEKENSTTIELELQQTSPKSQNSSNSNISPEDLNGAETEDESSSLKKYDLSSDTVKKPTTVKEILDSLQDPETGLFNHSKLLQPEEELDYGEMIILFKNKPNLRSYIGPDCKSKIF